MGLVVVYDANVLFPAPLRDWLIRIAVNGLVRAHRTEQILDECFQSILKVRPDLSLDNLARTRDLMNRAVRDALVSGYESLVNGLALPDPNDRHVLAAAIHCGATRIVTFNLRDFPDSKLKEYGIRSTDPDALTVELFHQHPRELIEVLTEQASALTNPPMKVVDLLEALENQGLTESVALIRKWLRKS